MKDFLRHLFLPHESNNHRPKLLHHHSMLYFIAILIFGFFLISSVQRDFPSVLGISFNVSTQDLLSLTNQKRQEKGLAPLALNGQLSQAAALKAQDMFSKNYWAHVAPDGTTPWVFIKNSGYEYLYAGENLARGFTTAPEVVDAWMASPSHRDNMLSPNYNEIGFAVIPGALTGSDTVLVVEMFGSRYLAKQDSPSTTSEPVAVVLTSPTPFIAPVISQVPTQTLLPTVTPSSSVQPTPAAIVAAVQNQPLIDSKSTTRQMSLFILMLFIAVFVIDAIIIERKKIVRAVSHNLDHIVFLTILLLAAIIIGKGAIL